MKNNIKLNELINNYNLNLDNLNINDISNIINEELDKINENINNNKINNENNINKNIISNENNLIMNIKANELNNIPNFFFVGITFPHKAGMDNVGHSCYMNATIECLSNVKSLTNYLLQKYGNFDIDNQPLCAAYSILLYELFHTKEKSISPKLFKEIIGKLNPLFEGNNGADPKDLLLFIIETLHKELNENHKLSNYDEIDLLKHSHNEK